MLPKCLYGCEVSKVNGSKQRRLTTVIKRAVSKKTRHKDKNLTFITSSYGADLDPETEILCRRVMLLRRITAKKPHLKQTAEKILDIYVQHEYAGTNLQNVWQHLTEPAPMAGHEWQISMATPFPTPRPRWYHAGATQRKRSRPRPRLCDAPVRVARN